MKSRSLSFITMMVLLAMAMSSCVPFWRQVHGSGRVVTEEREVSGFSKITIDCPGTITITQGEVESLEIKSDDNIITELTSDVVGNTLVLGIENNRWLKLVNPSNGIYYTLTVIDLSSIIINGAADLSMNDFTGDSLTIEINGAGKIELNNIVVNDLDVEINGAASAYLSGEVSSLSAQINGVGDIDAADLLATTGEIEINGLGNGTVWVTESLSISLSGGGSLNYYGSPTISQNISGAGNIVSLGDK